MADDKKICPECQHEFQGNGWDGIDAHWRSKHEHIMSYEDAWPLIQSDRYKRPELIKQLVGEFERRLNASSLIGELNERNLLSAVVDEQVAREFGFPILGGRPLGVKVSPELARKAAERHAYLLAECEKERARRLDAL